MSKLSSNIKIFLLTSVPIVISFIYSFFTENIIDFIKMSAWFAVILLFFTLVPINILRVIQNIELRKFVAKFAADKRVFGIAFGIIALVHTLVALWQKFDFNLNYLFYQDTITGLLAILIIVGMLISSNLWVQKKVHFWKMMHALIWFVLPLVTTHALMSEIFKLDGSSIFFLVILFSMLLFGSLKIIFKAEQKDFARDSILLISGLVVSLGVVLLVK